MYEWFSQVNRVMNGPNDGQMVVVTGEILNKSEGARSVKIKTFRRLVDMVLYLTVNDIIVDNI